MLNLQNNVLNITLPEGKTQQELLRMLAQEFEAIEKELYGKEIKINGRVTTAMCLWLGHKLAHVCKSVSIFDPKENSYILVIKH